MSMKRFEQTCIHVIYTDKTNLPEHFSDLKVRYAMSPQFLFLLNIKIKQAFPLLFHMRFLFSLNSP